MMHEACAGGCVEHTSSGNKHEEAAQHASGRHHAGVKVWQNVEHKLTFVGRLIPATELHPGELLFSTTFMAKSTALKPTAQVL